MDGRRTHIDLAEVDALVRDVSQDLQKVDRRRERVLQRDLRRRDARLGDVDGEDDGCTSKARESESARVHALDDAAGEEGDEDAQAWVMRFCV